MSTARIGLLLTAAVWLAAVAAVRLTPSPGWLDLRWPVALYFFAVPATILLWTFIGAARVIRPTLSRTYITAIGVLIPALVAAALLVGGPYVNARRERRLAAQRRSASLAWIADEPLPGAAGPIGVRLRYKVVYPMGLDLDEDHGAFAQLVPSPGLDGFVQIERTVTPQPVGTYGPGEYEITETFVPAFVPISILDRRLEAPGGRCLRWQSAGSREAVLASEPEFLSVAVYLAPVPIQRATSRRYRLEDFHANALLAGAVECQDAAAGR